MPTAGKYKGTEVTMAGPFTDNDAVKFDESVKDFEAATGIDIQYAGSKEFEASITISVDGGNAARHRGLPAARPAGHHGQEGPGR